MSTRHAALAAVLVLAAAPVSALEIASGDAVVDLSGPWLFHAGDNLTFAETTLDDRGWEMRILPTAGMPFAQRFADHGWYRLHLRVSPAATGAPLRLALGPARHVLEVYVNSVRVCERGRFGSRPQGGAAVVHLICELQPGRLRSGDNILALRVLDPTYASGLPSGPLAIGPPEEISTLTEQPSLVGLGSRLVLAIFALCLGLAQMWTVFGRHANRENWWLLGAALGATLLLLGDTGVLDRLLPDLTLATRVPLCAGLLSVLSLASYFAMRYGDQDMPHVRSGRITLLVLVAALLLVPEVVVFFSGSAILFFAGLLCALYAASQLSGAARRGEAGALLVFTSVLLAALMLLYDGISEGTSAFPSFGAIGLVLVLLATTAVEARNTAREHERVLGEMLRQRQQAEELRQVSILDAFSVSIVRPADFLKVVVAEAAGLLQMRRCSLVMPRSDGRLAIRAAVGLPLASFAQTIERGDDSIAGWVFEHGQPVTSESLPPELVGKQRGGYRSEAFICYPIREGEETLGVLSVSDRNGSSSISSEDANAVAAVAQKLAAAIVRLGLGKPSVESQP